MRLGALGLGLLLVIVGLTPGGIEPARADTVPATAVSTVDTSVWDPASPDPSGMVYIPATGRFIVVDSEVDEETGAGHSDFNIWEYDPFTDTVTGFDRLESNDEPTGAGYDPATHTLFISDDDPGQNQVQMIDLGVDQRYQSSDPIIDVIDLGAQGANDVEDPTFDPTTGHLFVMSGGDALIYEVDPATTMVVATIDISDLHATDNFEGLAYNPSTDHLMVGGSESNTIWEIAKTSPLAMFRQINANGVTDLLFVSGLAMAPASNGSGLQRLWVPDRGIDNSPTPSADNDGVLFELSFPAQGPVAPVAQNQSVTTEPNTAKVITLQASDGNGDDLTFVATDPPHGTLNDLTPSGNQVTYTPDSGYLGPDSFTFTADDGVTGLSNVATVSVTVQANQPPVLAAITTPRAANEMVNHTFTATATDVEGNPFEFYLTGQPTEATINASTGAFSFNPTEAQGPNQYTFTVGVREIANPARQDTQSVTINVAEVNRAPSITPIDSIARGEGDTVDITVGGTDPDVPANTFSWLASGLPSGLSINNSGHIVGTIANNAASSSPYAVTLTLNDNGTPNLSDTEAFTFEVTDDNLSPIMGPIGDKSVVKGNQLSFLATAADPNGDDLTFSLVSPPSGASITPSGLFTWTPTQDAGPYQVTVRVTDDGSTPLSDEETIVVTVNNPPPPPPPGGTPPGSSAVYSDVGDFNNDGRSDLVSYDGNNGRWWVYQSNGSKVVAKEWAKFSTISGWTTRLAGDFNGDNRTDIANFHPSNGTWWVNRSTGTSFSLSVWADYATPTGWGTRLVGDFNGDGRDDIADYHTATGGWWVSRGNANNTFTTTRWADFATSSGWKTHIVGDFNGDGRDDIASFHPSNGTWWVSRGNANNTFTTVEWADYTTASGWTTQIAGDFNNDGRDDIANFHPSNGTWWVSRSTGGGFTTPALWADYTTATGWTNQMTGDFTGDGRDDIANYYPGNGTWWISRSTGTTFTNPALWADFTTLTGWGIRLIGDYNNDGRDDIANRHDPSGNWIISRSTGTTFNTNTWHP